VDLELEPALDGEIMAVLQEPGRAGIDLCWTQHPAQPARWMLARPLDQARGILESLPPGLLVPLVGQGMAVRRVPARVAVHGRDARPQTTFRQRIEPAIVRHGKVDKRRDAAPQELGKGDLDASGSHAFVALQHREEFVKRAVVEPWALDLVGNPAP
jgi:hypothetical protein